MLHSSQSDTVRRVVEGELADDAADGRQASRRQLGDLPEEDERRRRVDRIIGDLYAHAWVGRFGGGAGEALEHDPPAPGVEPFRAEAMRGEGNEEHLEEDSSLAHEIPSLDRVMTA